MPSFILAVILLMGCVASAPKDDFPSPNYLGYAESQRRDFVEAFLQGRWCEAERLLALSTENFLQLDRFCDASYNYLLSWRLKAYIGQDDRQALEKAGALRDLGKGCQGYPGLVFPVNGETVDADAPGKDSAYRALIESGDFKGLIDMIAAEDNELYASVYARKGAVAAIAAGKPGLADNLLETALAVDSVHGWVVFLRRDWMLKSDLAGSDEEKEKIAERIGYLDEFIIPCK